MKPTTCGIVFVVFGVIGIADSTFFNRRKDAAIIKDENVMDVSDFSIYYDIETNQTIRDLMPRPWYKPGWRLRLPFTGGKCKCKGPQCTCCTGIRIETFNFDRKTCAIFTYNESESTLNMEVKMNNDSVYQRTFSATNLPPLCLPIPVPYLPGDSVSMCIRLFDASVNMGKLHVCMDIDTRIYMVPVLILHFDCMDMGADGVALSKPSNHTQSADEGLSVTQAGQADSDVYDIVTEEPIIKNKK